MTVEAFSTIRVCLERSDGTPARCVARRRLYRLRAYTGTEREHRVIPNVGHNLSRVRSHSPRSGSLGNRIEKMLMKWSTGFLVFFGFSLVTFDYRCRSRGRVVARIRIAGAA
jgi:hypothetical protein